MWQGALNSGNGGGTPIVEVQNNVVWQGNQNLRLAGCASAVFLSAVKPRLHMGSAYLTGFYAYEGKIYEYADNSHFCDYIADGNDLVIQGIWSANATTFEKIFIVKAS